MTVTTAGSKRGIDSREYVPARVSLEEQQCDSSERTSPIPNERLCSIAAQNVQRPPMPLKRVSLLCFSLSLSTFFFFPR